MAHSPLLYVEDFLHVVYRNGNCAVWRLNEPTR